jgi:formylglycine-generating enzyme required for sulfatase activity
MGSPEDEAGRGGDEPQHQVELTQGLWLQATEVTQAEWFDVLGGTPGSMIARTTTRSRR